MTISTGQRIHIRSAHDVWRQVDRREPDQCWPWIGPIARDQNRGRVKWRGRIRYAYRVVWEIANGCEFPEHLQARHTCDNPICVNPAHIIPGTHAENMRDMAERRRYYIPGLKGEAHPGVTVGSDLARSAVNEYRAGGQSQAAVAAKYGVAQATLGRWVRAEIREDIGTDPYRQGKGRTALARGGLKPCGTRAAYSRHVAAGEPPCDACREVNTTYMREYKRARRLRRSP